MFLNVRLEENIMLLFSHMLHTHVPDLNGNLFYLQ